MNIAKRFVFASCALLFLLSGITRAQTVQNKEPIHKLPVTELPTDLIIESVSYMFPPTDNNWETVCATENEIYHVALAQNLQGQDLIALYRSLVNNVDHSFLAYLVNAAAFNGHLEVVQILVDMLVENHYPLNFVSLAIQSAAKNGNFEIIDYFVYRFLSEPSMVRGLSLAIKHGVENGQCESVRALLNWVEIVTTIDLGEALVAATRSGNREIFKLLLVKGEYHISNNDYGNALWVAAQKNFDDMVILLFQTERRIPQFYLDQALASARHNGNHNIVSFCSSYLLKQASDRF